MKHYILLTFSIISLALTGTLVKAQPTITASSFTPQVGESFLLHIFNYTPAGVPGAAITWDFSTVSATGTSTVNYVDPSSTSSAASFSSSTLAANQSTVSMYYHGTSSDYYYDGAVASGNLVPYSDPEKLMHFPFTYEDTYSDNLAATFTSGVTIQRAGNVTVTGDAYGTLILPYGTINNVIRVKTTENYTDSYNVGSPVTLHYLTTIYHWYKAGTHYPLMTLTSLDQDGTVTQAATYLDQSHISAIEENFADAIQLNLFPNPSEDQSSITFNLAAAENVKLEVYNSTGQRVDLIEENRLAPGAHRYEINTADYATGLYTLKIEAGGKIATKKMSVL